MKQDCCSDSQLSTVYSGHSIFRAQHIQNTVFSGRSSAVSLGDICILGRTQRLAVSLPIVMGMLVGEAAKSSIARSTQPTITIVTVKLTNKWH